MIVKKENAELDETGKFIILDEVLWVITNHHHYADLGETLDSFTIVNFAGEQKKIYSYDEGETFTFDVY
tara:strand:+ start:291 stop:497 length:207 start_codon:yes stop_codon:yes gene_type:complete